ncbi:MULTISPECIES: inositol monophosphatase family protein [Brevibacterium]|uniref:inositol monophosphatase family protein n=1 Tax=Brevibacterium TaxID=1696 RepID=UPI001FEC5CC8|nr:MULTISPECIES: inositol monophosphatase family protein [Brevibacterium]
MAFELADAADKVTLGGFLGVLDIELKSDRSPVTAIDRNAETAIRQLLAQYRPGDAVHGEEHEDTGAGNRQWIIDPIDGTKNFIREVPVWASLISLSVDDIVTVAVVSAPALSRRWWAVRDEGAHAQWFGPGGVRTRKLTVSEVDAFEEASFSYSSMRGWTENGLETGFLDLQRATWRQRAFGDFWSYVLLAEGAVDIAAEPEVPLYDLAAVSLIVEEAGGTFTDISGRRGPGGGSAVATNGILHERVLSVLTDTNTH